jgi:hypothetical protein
MRALVSHAVILSIHSRKTAIRDVRTSAQTRTAALLKTQEFRADVLESAAERRISLWTFLPRNSRAIPL